VAGSLTVLHATTLPGPDVTLVPLAAEHAGSLAALVDEDVWAWMSGAVPGTVPAMQAHIEAAGADPTREAFAVLLDAEPVGSTSFYDTDTTHLITEIGHTFYGRAHWGTRVNPAAKLLLLTEAFDVRGLHRVALRTDHLNTRSQAAIARLGAVREGVLRSHRARRDGSRRDTVYFSVTRPEWPAVRAGLERRLAA